MIGIRGYKPILILLLGLSLRLAYVFWGPPLSDFMWSDMKGYINIADKISSGIWERNHFFQSIGFPLVIYFVKKISSNWTFTLSLLQAIASSLALIPIYLMTRDSFGQKIGLIALTIAACHVPWILFTGLALPETLYSFLLSICGWMSVLIVREEKPSILPPIIWGIAFMGAFWLKGLHVFWAPLFLLGLIIYKRMNALLTVKIIALTLLSGLLLHGMLSSSKANKFQLSASTGGLNFMEGKCPIKKNIDSLGYSWISPLYYQLDLHTEKKWYVPFNQSSFYLIQGLECIKENPFVLVQSLEGIPFLFYGNLIWPLNQMKLAAPIRLYEVFFSLFLVCGLMLFFRYLISRRNFPELLIWGMPVLALFLCVYIFKSEVRYRLPFDVWLIPMAVRGFCSLKITSFEEVKDSGVDTETT